MSLSYLTALLALGFCIALHEFGHFFALKALGCRVLRFAVGLGPGLKFQRKETLYTVGALLLVGFVERDQAEKAPPWKNLIVAAAGPLFSFLLGVAFLYAYMRHLIGTTAADPLVGPPREAMTQWQFMWRNTLGLINGQVVSITSLFEHAQGPVGIVQNLSKAADDGVGTLLFTLATTNFGVGAFNLIPLPPLDGGQMVFDILEIGTGRKFSNLRLALGGVGLLLIIAVLGKAFLNDIFG